MFAIIEVASKQFKVKEGDVINIPHTVNKELLMISNVLMIVDEKDIKIGTPFVKDSKVVCEVIGDVKGPKVVAYKFKRRKSYHRKVGHREIFTKVKIKEIKIVK